MTRKRLYSNVRLRTVREIATGKERTQSSSKTKALLRTGEFVEVEPEGMWMGSKHESAKKGVWRRMWDAFKRN